MSAPGWYPDPSDPSRQRYFDGRAWTEHYALAGGLTPAVKPAKTGMSNGMKVGLAAGAGVLGLAVLGSIGDNDKSSSAPSRSGSTSTVDITPTTTKSAFTPSQDNAIAKAKSYLEFSAYSKEGLRKQLEYEKFSTADATFAVDYVETNQGVDWNEQAVEKAKSYLDFSAYSLEGLIGQLEYEGFTPAQAQYGANKAYSG
jgi:hypothetical protein